jgi:hypothetical protein
MKIKLGDIFEIPLSEGKKAYGQYIFWDDKNGPLIQVFDLIVNSSHTLNLMEIEGATPLFPPVLTGLFAAIKNGLWKVVGNLPVKDFKYPGFISTFYDQKTGKARTWYLWNGRESIRLGDSLPAKYKNLEYLVIWSPFDISDRIETGEVPYPYGDLIRFNEFIPVKT